MRDLIIRMKALETRAQDLLTEIKSMKNMVVEMETENEKLRRHLALLYDVRRDGEPPPVAGGAGERVTGQKNLQNLYAEGFHICNIHFGRVRTSECLFCAAFLRRERE